MAPLAVHLAVGGRRSRRELAARRDRLARAAAAHPDRSVAFSYEDAIDFLVDRGVHEYHLREGTMPEESLAVVADAIEAQLDHGRPLVGLQVGNFVGVSLAFLSDRLRRHDERSVMVSVDPGLPHRGVDRPQDHVLRLLRRYGLQRSNLVVTAFSLSQNLGDDGFNHTDEGREQDLFSALEATAAGEAALANLATLAPAGFDLVLLDGNHDGGYLQREIEVVRDLLRPGGLLVLDDLQWDGVRSVFADLTAPGSSFAVVAGDGSRVSVLRRRDRAEAARPAAVG